MRDGTPVEILKDDMGPEWPILLRRLDNRGVWQVEYRREGGRSTLAAPENSGDLIPRPVTHSGWVLVAMAVDPVTFVAYCSQMCRTQADALKFCHGPKYDLACIKVEFTEGEGLENLPAK